MLFIFEVYTCKLDWILNFNFLKYLTTIPQINVSKISPTLLIWNH